MRTNTTAPQWAIRLFAVLFLATVYNFSFANNRTVISNSGNGWSVATNWSPLGVPEDGDTVYIPAGFTIKVKGQIYSSGEPCLVIKVMGTIEFDPSGRLELSANSKLNLMPGASITSHGSSSELVKIGGVEKFNGQTDGTITGPAYASSDTGNTPNGFTPGVLAIKLQSFTAKLLFNSVVLSWLASSDNLMDHFIVQKSSDGSVWTELIRIDVANANGEPIKYQYSDPAISKQTVFYRIALGNADGKNTYSMVVPVIPELSAMKMFPNPAVGATSVVWNQSSNANLYIEISDVKNNLVRKQLVAKGNNFALIETSSLPTGIYFVTVTDGQDLRACSKLFVTK
jgi:hypothetical protein